VLLGVEVGVVDAVDERGVGAGRRCGDHDNARSTGEVCRGLVAFGEEAGGLHDDVDAERLPRQLGGVAFGKHAQRLAVDRDAVVGGRNRVGQHTHHRVVLEQVRHGLLVAEVVDGDDLHLRPAFLCCSPETAPDSAEAVDSYSHGHAQRR